MGDLSPFRATSDDSGKVNKKKKVRVIRAVKRLLWFMTLQMKYCIYIFGSYNCLHPDYSLGYSNGHLISQKCMEEITAISAANREAKVLTLVAGRYAAQLV